MEHPTGQLRSTVNLKILLDTRVRQSIRKYYWTPACGNQLKILLDNRVRQSIWKFSRTTACDSEFPLSKGRFSLQPVFPIETLEQDKRV